MSGVHDPRGSLWHRWDPHLHAPGTLRNDQFGGDWDAYLDRTCPVQVEVDVSFGLPSFTVVGLPEAGVRESRDRVRSAIRNSGFHFPPHHVTVNLAPADLRKAGRRSICPLRSASWPRPGR